LNTESLIEDDVQAFRKSLICTLSLSSKELFHSNLIGWLMENNLEFAKAITDESSLRELPKVEREKSNFDLLVKAGDKNYIIENKVKSLPCTAQIAKYKEKAEKLKLDAIFILLSLMPPDEGFAKIHDDVRVLTYEKILKVLEDQKIGSSFESILLQDYCQLLSILIKIKKSVMISLDDTLAIRGDQENLLKSMRLFDIAQKIRYSYFATLADQRLKALSMPKLLALKEPTEVALTRSTGLMSLKFGFKLGDNQLLIGIQIQGDQYRYFVQSCEKKDVQEIAEKLQNEKLWLNPERSDNKNVEKILKFGKDFKYDYAPINVHTVAELLQKIEKDVRRLATIQDDLKNKLNIEPRKILKSP
jgi:hypothetical protein